MTKNKLLISVVTIISLTLGNSVVANSQSLATKTQNMNKTTLSNLTYTHYKYKDVTGGYVNGTLKTGVNVESIPYIDFEKYFTTGEVKNNFISVTPDYARLKKDFPSIIEIKTTCIGRAAFVEYPDNFLEDTLTYISVMITRYAKEFEPGIKVYTRSDQVESELKVLTYLDSKYKILGYSLIKVRGDKIINGSSEDIKGKLKRSNTEYLNDDVMKIAKVDRDAGGVYVVIDLEPLKARYNGIDGVRLETSNVKNYSEVLDFVDYIGVSKVNKDEPYLGDYVWVGKVSIINVFKEGKRVAVSALMVYSENEIKVIDIYKTNPYAEYNPLNDLNTFKTDYSKFYKVPDSAVSINKASTGKTVLKIDKTKLEKSAQKFTKFVLNSTSTNEYYGIDKSFTPEGLIKSTKYKYNEAVGFEIKPDGNRVFSLQLFDDKNNLLGFKIFK